MGLRIFTLITHVEQIAVSGNSNLSHLSRQVLADLDLYERVADKF